MTPEEILALPLETLLDALSRRISSMQIASCRCQTKTPEPRMHNKACPYAVLCAMEDAVEEFHEWVTAAAVTDVKKGDLSRPK